MSRFLPLTFLALLLSTVGAFAQSTLTYDLETSGQFSANFRAVSSIGTGTAAQTTVGANTFFRHDSTSGGTGGAYLFDQTPADSTYETQSAFRTTGPITVAYDMRAVTTNSSFAVIFADPANLSNNIMGIFNLVSGADTLRVFKDGVLTATSAGAGTQVGTTTTVTTAAEPNTGTFTPLSVTLTVSGTTPTLSVTAAGSTASFTFASGDFNWSKTCVLVRINDAGPGANTPCDIDNISIVSPSAPESPVDPNTAPTLPTQPNRSVAVLSTLVVDNGATDHDLPAQTLTYALTTAPAGATISAGGVITWAPTEADVSPTPYTFTTQVTDSGTPALSATNAFHVTVTAAPSYPFSHSFGFAGAGDFGGNFRVLSAIGGGKFDASAGGTLLLDANSSGGNTSSVFVYDGTPDDATAATQTGLPISEEIRVSFLARARTAGSSFAVSFADPRNANNRITALFLLNAGDDVLRFYRDGSLTATSNNTGTQVGTDITVDTGGEPDSGVFVPVTAVLNVSGTTPTITFAVGSAAPVTSAFAAGDLDWAPTLVLVRLADASASNNTPVEIDNLVIAGGAPVAVPAPVLPPAPGADGNLITVNPSFESGSLNNFSGSYSFTGWTGTNALFSNHAINTGSVAAGTTTHGTKYLRQSPGGTLTTAATARPPAKPGTTFELTYDQRSLVRNFPSEKLGCTPTIEFFDTLGVRIKQAWNFAGRYRIQDTGINTWETFTVRAVAPPGTAYVGLFFNNPAGRFVDSDNNYTQDRHVEMDNIRLELVPERVDRLTYRRAPRLVEPGKTAGLKINHATTAARILRVALVDAAGSERATSAVPVPAGRFRATPVTVAIPGSLPDGTYSWKIELLPISGGPAVATQHVPGVLCDQTVAAPTAANGTDFDADHPRIQLMGRVENTNPKQQWLHWFGSEVRVRFSGTSLALRGSMTDNGFDAAESTNVQVVIDENFSSPITVTLNSFNFVKTLISGLSDGVHSARIFKANETDISIRIDGFRVDASRGLLIPEPLPNRRIEIYGDSVTSGGTASPGFNGYAPLLGGELDADVHIVSKGGTGVAASFSNQDILVNYYDNLSFPNVFNASSSNALPWDFNRWTADLVICAIGHNDQFNNGGATFNARYAEFKGYIRNAYPNAKFLTANTLISANLGQFQNAVDPLIAGDPLHSFAFQPNTWSDSATGHPPTAGHHAQIYGDERRYSLADVVEDRLGTGLNAPLTAYQQWATEEFSPAEIAAGWHAPAVSAAGDETNNLLRFSLGLPTFGPVSGDAIQIIAFDSEVRLTLTFFRASAEAQYIVELSDDLASWTPAAVNPGAVGTVVTFTDNSPPPINGRRFARLRISTSP